MDNRNIAIFDLDHTLLPIDSDFEWGEFMCRIGAVQRDVFEEDNRKFFGQYQAGTLDNVEYLEFALGTLARFSADQLETMHEQFMHEVIKPAILPVARQLVEKHRDDLLLMITATNRFVTAPIAAELGFDNLIAALPEFSPDGRITGKLLGTPTSGIGKVSNLHAWLDQRGTALDRYERSYFYSDSHNDIPLLEVVSDPVATNPDRKLSDLAHRNGWPILHLFK